MSRLRRSFLFAILVSAAFQPALARPIPTDVSTTNAATTNVPAINPTYDSFTCYYDSTSLITCQLCNDCLKSPACSIQETTSTDATCCYEAQQGTPPSTPGFLGYLWQLVKRLVSFGFRECVKSCNCFSRDYRTSAPVADSVEVLTSTVLRPVVTAPPTPTTFTTLTMVATPTTLAPSATAVSVHSISNIRRMTEAVTPSLTAVPSLAATPSPTAALSRATSRLCTVCPLRPASLANVFKTARTFVCSTCGRHQSVTTECFATTRVLSQVLSLIRDALITIAMLISIMLPDLENMEELLCCLANSERAWLASLATGLLTAPFAAHNLSVQVTKAIEKLFKWNSVFSEKASFLTAEVGIVTVLNLSRPSSFLEVPWSRCSQDAVETMLRQNRLIVIKQPANLPAWLTPEVQVLLKAYIDEAAAQRFRIIPVPASLRFEGSRGVVSGLSNDGVAGQRVVSSSSTNIPERPLLLKRVRPRGHGAIQFNVEESHLVMEERANPRVSQFKEIMTLQPIVQSSLEGALGIFGRMFPRYKPVGADPEVHDDEISEPVSAEDARDLKCKDVVGWDSLTVVQKSIESFMMDAVAWKRCLSMEIRHFLLGSVRAADKTIYMTALQRHWGAIPRESRGQVLTSVLENLKALTNEYDLQPDMSMSDFAERIIKAASYAKSDTSEESIRESLKARAAPLERLKYRLEGRSKRDKFAKAFGKEPKHEVIEGICDIHGIVHEQVEQAVKTVFEAVALNYYINILVEVDRSLRSAHTQ